jgi:hypothetical protein
MTKPKTWVDFGLSLEADWPASPPTTIRELVGEARAANWDFTGWCSASGYDESDPDARRMFDCLLAFARREGGAGLN